MNMHLRLSHNNDGRRIPKPLEEYIRKRFLLLPEYMKLLRCFEHEGVVGDKPVRRFKVFSTRDIKSKNLLLKTENDLEKYPELILFEGYIDKSGKAYAADRRMPVKGKKQKK